MIVYQMAPQDFTLGVAEDQIELYQTIEVLLQGVRLNDKKPLSSSAVLMVLSTDGTVTLMNDERVVKKGIEYSTNNVIDLNHASQAIIKEGVIQILAEQHREHCSATGKVSVYNMTAVEHVETGPILLQGQLHVLMKTSE